MVATAHFTHGQFYGRFDHRRDLAGFTLARLAATVPEHEVAPHEHEDAHFICVLDEGYRSSASGAAGLLRPGGVIFNPPGTRHRDCFETTGGRFLALTLGASRYASLQEAGLREQGAQCLTDPSAAALALTLAGRCAETGPASALMLEELAMQLLAAVCGLGGRDQRGLPASMRRARELLEDEALQDLGIDAIAREAGVHPVYLARAFRHHFGLTPGEFQRRARLDRAAALLRSGKVPVNEVALACAFADQSHLTRTFRTVYGIAPAAYRRMFRAGADTP
jgi:AraC family transcriptional regulator